MHLVWNTYHGSKKHNKYALVQMSIQIMQTCKQTTLNYDLP